MTAGAWSKCVPYTCLSVPCACSERPCAYSMRCTCPACSTCPARAPTMHHACTVHALSLPCAHSVAPISCLPKTHKTPQPRPTDGPTNGSILGPHQGRRKSRTSQRRPRPSGPRFPPVRVSLMGGASPFRQTSSETPPPHPQLHGIGAEDHRGRTLSPCCSAVSCTPLPPCNFQDQDLYPPSLRLASMLSVWYCLQSEDGHCHCPVFRQHACHTGQLSKCKQSLDALVLRKYKMTSKGACTV